MSEIIHQSERGTVEIFTENGEKRLRRTVNAECPVYETLKNADCQYLPKIYSADISDGKTVVTEDFIEGKNLLAANPDEKQVIRAMVQLCSALDFIHGLGIIHRDIKPSNILLWEDGRIRLIDFEAARFVRADKDKDTRYLGTEGFAPPEQYGFSQTDFRADVYAAGQTMKTLLGSLSAKKKYAKIIRKCTALDPAERYQNARALAYALTSGREKISAAALFSLAAAALIFAAAVPREAPAENIPDEAEIAAEAETASETATVSETESVSETTVPTETESTSETTVHTETESTSETTVHTETEIAYETTVTETEITAALTTASETESAAVSATVSQTETTAKTVTSAETKAAAVTTAAYTETIPDNLPVSLSSKEYASLPKRQQYYTKVNIQSPAYAWVGNEETGFKVNNGSYLLKNTAMWVAMYRNDYINNDILINGKAVTAASSGGSSNFGAEYTIGADESVLNITSQPTVSRKSTVRLEDNGIEVSYYVDDLTKGGYINNGDTVRFDTPLLIGCYKNLIAGYDITVNGKALSVQSSGDNTYMLGLYTPNSKETVIGKVKRSKLTEYEKTNFVPVYFSSEVRVYEFPFSSGDSSDEWYVTYSSGALIEKGSKLRITVKPSYYTGKTLKINGNAVNMIINGDESNYLFDYIIPKDINSLNITL